MTAYPAPPPPSFLPIPHTAPTHTINLPPTPPYFPTQAHLPPYFPTQAHLPPMPTFPPGQKGNNHRRGSLGQGLAGMRRGSGGLGLVGHTGSGPVETFGRPPISVPPPFFQPQSDQAPILNMPLPPVPMTGPRPHPHLTTTILYISNVPHDLPEVAIADALRDCLPVNIKLNTPVNHEDRLKPDAYYDWMPRAGTLHLTNLHSAEKALSILVAHPYLAHAGLIVSTYPPPTSPFALPHVLPFPDPPVPARYMRPTQQIILPPPSAELEDAAAALSAQVPSLGELFDIIRPWGSLRQITVWFEDGQPAEGGAPPTLSWGARVVFWYEDEARRFEVGFGATGLLIKGWQIYIFAEQLLPPPPPFTFDPTSEPAPPAQPRLFPLPEHPPFQFDPNAANTANVDPEIFRRMAMPIFPTHPTQPFGVGPHHPLPPTPSTPSNHFKPAPWANHNIFASKPMSKTQSLDRRSSVPTGPNAVQLGMRRSMSNMQIAPTTPGHARQRTWSVTLESSVEGELVATGIQGSDGTMIHHGPGQHIRPAPAMGPGSNSASGLVDYSNVFVKNLDPDINSYALDDIFSNVGRIVSAKVMRDDFGRSRGYGFVSFYSPNEAAHAIAVMNGTKVGSQQIAVTLHEPRRLRPEKLADRFASPTGGTTPTSKRWASPTREEKRNRHQSAPVQVSSTKDAIDDLYAFSIDERKLALVKRVTGPVHRYARVHRVPDGYIEPAIKALVAHDLALLPHLHDPKSLEHKIAETLSVLQEDPELNINIGVAPAGLNLPLDRPQPPSPQAPVLAESELRAKLLAEVARIDPKEAGDATEILWGQLQPFERSRVLESRGYLAMRYGVAKRELRRRQVAKQDSADKGSSHAEDTSTVSSNPSPPSSLTTSTSTTHSSTSHPPQIEYIRLADITLESLASRSTLDIMAHLSSPLGADVLAKLGMSRPTSDDAGQLARWILAVREKPALQRDAEIAAVVAKHFEVGWGKKFVQLKVARELVQREDAGALCKLIAYPKLLDAKARILYESTKV